MTRDAGEFDEILLVEDNKSTAERLETAEGGTPGSRPAMVTNR